MPRTSYPAGYFPAIWIYVVFFEVTFSLFDELVTSYSVAFPTMLGTSYNVPSGSQIKFVPRSL
jgi:hypothetical protein